MRPMWGWAGTVQQLLTLPNERWLESLTDHHVGLHAERPSASQLAAWRDELIVMTASLRDVCVADPSAVEWGVIFEYELPLENGRRPDVVVLAGSAIVVLEFKQDTSPRPAAVDQVQAYARDLAEYHEESHGRPVTPVVVLTRTNFAFDVEGATVVDPSGLAGVLLRSVEPGTIELDQWLNSAYAPLPTLIAAARRIFEHEPLPAVRRALSTGIPEAVQLLGHLAEEASRDGGRVLAFVAPV